MEFEFRLLLHPAVAVFIGGLVTTGAGAAWYWVRRRFRHGSSQPELAAADPQPRVERREPPTIVSSRRGIPVEPRSERRNDTMHS